MKYLLKSSLRACLSLTACLVLATTGDSQAPTPGRSGALAGFPDLVGALKASPGCLGVETARTSSGKNVIFAWFENKEAVRKWYYSDTHLKAMKMGVPGSTLSEPLKGVPDNIGPVMVIASLTVGDKPPAPGMTIALSQISIEMYTPIAGGIVIGGRFSPEALKVPGMRDLTPPK